MGRALRTGEYCSVFRDLDIDGERFVFVPVEPTSSRTASEPRSFSTE